MKSIVLEGPDCIGKTTAAEKLREMTDLEVRHMGVPPYDFDYANDYFRTFDRNKPAIYDRLHLGALVYGVWGRLHPTDGFHYDSWLAAVRSISANAVVILMYAENDQWYKNHLKNVWDKESEEFSGHDLIGVNERYRFLTKFRLLGFDPLVDFPLAVDCGGFPTKSQMLEWILKAKGATT